MNILKRVEILECQPYHDAKSISDLQNRICLLEEIIENKLGFYIPKR